MHKKDTCFLSQHCPHICIQSRDSTCTGLQGDDKRKLDEIYQDKRKLDEIYQDTLERKRAKSEIYLSQIRTADMQRMAEKAGLSFKVAKLPEERSKGNTDGFGWDDRLEKLQHDR